MGSQSVALLVIPMLQPQFLVRLPMRGVRRSVPLAIYLHDAALDPLYAEGEPVVVPYVWKGSNAAGYDPDVQNVFADMPMSAAAIKAAEDEFLNRGTAKKSLAKSCEKTGTCVPEINAWEYLPVSEVSQAVVHDVRAVRAQREVFDR